MAGPGAIAEEGDKVSMVLFCILATFVTLLFASILSNTRRKPNSNGEGEASRAEREEMISPAEGRSGSVKELKPNKRKRKRLMKSVTEVSLKIVDCAGDSGKACVKSGSEKLGSRITTSRRFPNLIDKQGPIVSVLELGKKVTDFAVGVTKHFPMLPYISSGCYVCEKIGRTRVGTSIFGATSIGEFLVDATAGYTVVKGAVKKKARELQNVTAESVGKVVRRKYGEGAGQATEAALNVTVNVFKIIVKAQKSVSWWEYIGNPVSWTKAAAKGASESRAAAERCPSLET